MPVGCKVLDNNDLLPKNDTVNSSNFAQRCVTPHLVINWQLKFLQVPISPEVRSYTTLGEVRRDDGTGRL